MLMTKDYLEKFTKGSVASTLDKKAFRFTYRMCNDPPHVHFVR